MTNAEAGETDSLAHALWAWLAFSSERATGWRTTAAR